MPDLPKFTFTGTLRIEDQEGGYAEPVLGVGPVNIASEVESLIEDTDLMAPASIWGDLVARGTWRVTIEQIEK